MRRQLQRLLTGVNPAARSRVPRVTACAGSPSLAQHWRAAAAQRRFWALSSAAALSRRCVARVASAPPVVCVQCPPQRFVRRLHSEARVHDVGGLWGRGHHLGRVSGLRDRAYARTHFVPRRRTYGDQGHHQGQGGQGSGGQGATNDYHAYIRQMTGGVALLVVIVGGISIIVTELKIRGIEYNHHQFTNNMVWTIIGLNAVVFGLWRIPPLLSFMRRYFMHASHSPLILSSVGAFFSHISLMHLAFNMFAFHSFGSSVGSLMSPFSFLSFYLMSGVFSSMFSTTAHFALRRPCLGLGASGAVVALATLYALTNPDAEFFLIFFPFMAFPAINLIGALVVFDVVGLLAGWRVLGHAAHLGGALFAYLIHKGIATPAIMQLSTSIAKTYLTVRA